jgi:two-component system cell cycle sensor histidine kinase/response regulator CckA
MLKNLDLEKNGVKDKPVILAVDDQSQNLDLFEAQLGPRGYEVVTANNGEEALRILTSNQIDLVLLDVMMPGMDGFEVTRRIRKDDKNQQLPIVLVTSLRETEDRIKGIEAGCDDFLLKPVDKLELLARVQSLLRAKAYNDLTRDYRDQLESEVSARTAELNHTLENLHQEITERKQAEEMLRESEVKHRTLFETMAQGVVYQNADGYIASANPAAVRILGLTLDQMQGRTPTDPGRKAIHEDGSDFPGDMHPGLVALRTGKEVRNVVMGMFHPKINGYVWINVYAIPQFKQGKAKPQQVYTTFADITEHKMADEERLRTEKLESIGMLAGGIAHDFNNILTGILGNIELANEYLKQNKADMAQEVMVEAEKASLRAKDIAQQLLTFSKGGVPVKKVMLINQLLKESVDFALRGSNVKPELTIADNLCTVEADAGQLNQVIENIVINANQAMPNGGVLKVCACNVVIKKNKTISLPDGKYIEIAIQDHGIGIPEENKAHMFEPYFTTKKQGSGLGLPTSYSIIKNHGGQITFESKLGIGTTLHIYLPATKEKAKKVREELSTLPMPLTQGRILIMDDEDLVRRLLGRILTGAGYEVELTRDGTEAIKKYTEARESRNPFDAVILDLTIPGGMGGKEAIEKLLKIHPGINAIVSSGYANDPIMADYKKYGFKGVVTKPYNIRQMQETLRDTINTYTILHD